MIPKTKNIIIFITIGVVLVLVYFFFIKKGPEQPNLISTSPTTSLDTNIPNQNSPVVAENNSFLSLLLNINSIKLDDSIFSDPTWNTLQNNSIVLEPDLNPGRPNPFAPLGTDLITNTTTDTNNLTTTTNTKATTNIPKPITN